MQLITRLSVTALFCSVMATAVADDWPQYRGPKRNDVSMETGLLKEWPSGGPALLWTYAEAGVGYSGPAVVGDRYYTIGARGEEEFLIALDLKDVKDQTVKEAWATKVGKTFEWTGNKWTAGPSATPTVDGNLIYALGGNGDLICVEAATGLERWRKNLPADLGAEVNPIGGGPKKLGWGFTWSPLVDGDRLICLPGGPRGTVAALDKNTGEVVWRSTELPDQAAYTSPMLAEFDGVRQYVVLTNQSLAGIDAKDGKLLWRSPRRNSTEVCNSPIVEGKLVYTTIGSANGCDLVRIEREGDKFNPVDVYNNRNLANHHGNVLLVAGHIYGNSQGRGWVCQNLESGEIVWSERAKFPPGAITYADSRIYCYSENDGAVALIEANTTGWKESGRFKIPKQSTLRKPNGKIWTPPVVSGGKLFLRDQELVFCYDVRSKG